MFTLFKEKVKENIIPVTLIYNEIYKQTQSSRTMNKSLRVSEILKKKTLNRFANEPRPRSISSLWSACPAVFRPYRPAWLRYTYSDALSKLDNQRMSRSLSGESRACFVNDSRAFPNLYQSIPADIRIF